MKKILMILAGLSTLTTLSVGYADPVKLYVSNDSSAPIKVTMDDRRQFHIAEKTRIANIEIADFSEVKNYIKNKYVCSWYLNIHPLPNHELVGLTLTDHFKCKLDYTQGP